MTSERAQTGNEAEQRALDHLQGAGLKLVARNLRYRGGEIDLLMRDRDDLVVVEVRKRSHRGFGGAGGSVDRRKCQRIIIATQCWLAENPREARRGIRFDVVAIDAADQIDWIRAAFTADE